MNEYDMSNYPDRIPVLVINQYIMYLPTNLFMK